MCGSQRNGRRLPDSGESGYGIEDVEGVEDGKDVVRLKVAKVSHFSP